MPIRFATLSDVPALVASATRAHALTRLRSQPYNTQRATEAFTTLIEQRRSKYGCFVAEDARGRIVGTLIGTIEQQILSDARTASVMHFSMLPESRVGEYGVRLLRAFETWSANRGATEIEFGVDGAEVKRLGRLARKVGFRAMGRSYVKEAQV